MDENLELLEPCGDEQFEDPAGGQEDEAPDRFSEGADDGSLEDALIDVDGELVPLSELGGFAPEETDGPAPTGQDRLGPYLELLERYPELRDPGLLPRETAEAIHRGENPVVAYQDFLLRQQDARLQAESQREALRARCPGSATGYGDCAEDGAFAAFDEVLNGYY